MAQQISELNVEASIKNEMDKRISLLKQEGETKDSAKTAEELIASILKAIGSSGSNLTKEEIGQATAKSILTSFSEGDQKNRIKNCERVSTPGTKTEMETIAK